MSTKIIVTENTDFAALTDQALVAFCDADGVHPGERWFDLYRVVTDKFHQKGASMRSVFDAGYNYLTSQNIHPTPAQRMLAEGSFMAVLGGKSAKVKHEFHPTWSHSGVYAVWMVFLALVFLIGGGIASNFIGSAGKAYHWAAMSNGIYASGSVVIVLALGVLGAYIGYGIATKRFRHSQPA